jgi:outer membrane receptor protein involved in Fe transport
MAPHCASSLSVSLAAPCESSSEEQISRIAEAVAAAGARLFRAGAYKPRTSPYAFRGHGEAALDMLVKVREQTGLPIVTLSQNPSKQDQYTQEFRYAYSGEAFDFVLGAFAFDQRIDTQGTEQHGPASSRWTIAPTNPLSNDPSVLNGLTARNTQFLESTSLALFGQLSWKVTDAFTIQPGARINYDKKRGFYERRVFTGTGTELTGRETDARSRAQLAVFQPQVSAPEDSDWNLTYDLTASYQLAPDVLAYSTYAKSFKTIGINQNGLPTDASGQPIAAAGSIRPEITAPITADGLTRAPSVRRRARDVAGRCPSPVSMAPSR